MEYTTIYMGKPNSTEEKKLRRYHISFMYILGSHESDACAHLVKQLALQTSAHFALSTHRWPVCEVVSNWHMSNYGFNINLALATNSTTTAMARNVRRFRPA